MNNHNILHGSFDFNLSAVLFAMTDSMPGLYKIVAIILV